MKKTISFYKINIKRNVSHVFYKESDFFNILNHYIGLQHANIHTLPSGEHYNSLQLDDNTIIDIITFSKDVLFGTVGYIKNTPTMQRLRDSTNLEQFPLSVNADMFLEQYTYFYIDLNVGIVSVISSKVAPNIKQLSLLFKEDPNIVMQITPIMDNNIKSSIGKVEDIASVELSFTSPPLKALGRCNARIINMLATNGYEKFNLTFKADRSLRKKRDVQPAIETIQEIYDFTQNDPGNGSIDKFIVKYSLPGSNQTTVNLLEPLFTESVDIEIDEDFDEMVMLSYLQITYNALKLMLCSNIQLYNEIGEEFDFPA